MSDKNRENKEYKKSLLNKILALKPIYKVVVLVLFFVVIWGCFELVEYIKILTDGTIVTDLHNYLERDKTYLNYTMGERAVELELLGEDMITVQGNNLNNKITVGNGGAGSDYLYGGAGNDVIRGFVGNDKLFGENGDDVQIGANGSDTLYGGEGKDVLIAGSPVYTANVLKQLKNRRSSINHYKHQSSEGLSSYLYGGNGEDLLIGDKGRDSLYGGEDNDYIYGGLGNDYLSGDEGDDTLSGDEGNDVMNGGEGIYKVYKFNKKIKTLKQVA